MANNALLEQLVAELKPVRPRRPGIEAVAFVSLCALELMLWLASGHARAGLMHIAGTTPTFWWKAASAGALAVIGATTAITSLDPTRSPRRGLVALAGVLAVSVVVGALFASRAGLANLWDRLDWTDGLNCVARIVLLSAPPMAAFGLLLRRGAPTDLSGTALAASVAAAAWAACVFFFTCPHDDPIYILAWYPIACGVSAVAARLVLSLAGRW